MKAILYRQYGSPDVLKVEEIAKPTPKDTEVLIKVHAASVNTPDRLFRGASYFVRLFAGLRTPKDPRLGRDVAGRVEAVGRYTNQFRSGDEVFGMCRGAFAEYACAPESTLAKKPANMTFEQAAAVPVVGVTALQGLRDKGKLKPGQKVLINGASGGMGTFAVQIAKSFGAHVTGVCSTRNLDLVRSIGADQVIDYTREDFTQSGQHYDLIFDIIGNHSLSACQRVLNPNGTCVLAGGANDIGTFLMRGLKAVVLSRHAGQKFVMFIEKMNSADLTTMREYMETGKVTPVIDRRYRLSDVPEAIRYLEEGHARGKIVITFED